MIRYSKSSSWPLKAVLFSLFLSAPLPSFAEAASAQVGFSPEGTAQVLVLNVIKSAQSSIHMIGYNFTARDIAEALINAKKRGVNVQVVLDYKENQNRYSQAVMNLLVNAGIDVRTSDYYKIQHDKVIIVDARHVETGSFNFTSSAEKSNSENALVMWNAPQLANEYLQHWQSRWDKGTPYHSSY